MKNKGQVNIMVVLGLLVAIIALPVAIVLVGRQADTRNFASGRCPPGKHECGDDNKYCCADIIPTVPYKGRCNQGYHACGDNGLACCADIKPVVTATKKPKNDPKDNVCNYSAICKNINGVKDDNGQYLYFKDQRSAQCMCGISNWSRVGGLYGVQEGIQQYVCGTMWCPAVEE